MTTATDHAYSSLREEILAGARTVGQRLGELEISKELQVSRTPVREALRRLEADGLVEIAPQRGARVISPKTSDLRDVFDLRERLETAAAAAAATQITEAQLSELESLARHMMDLAQGKRGENAELDRTNANANFHDLILVASGNRRLREIVNDLTLVPLVVGTFRSYTDVEMIRAAAHHLELVDAIRARDPVWAASVMCSHIRAARNVLARTHPNPPEEEQ